MKALLSLLLVTWFFGVLFFVNRAQASYCDAVTSVIERPFVANGKPVIAFEHYSHLPDTSIAFHFLRDSLKKLVQPADKLKITGHFTQSESDVDRNLGLKRANAIRSLFEGYMTLDKIEIESMLSDRGKMSTSFEILTDRLTQNALDTPVPPMMVESQVVNSKEVAETKPVKKEVNEEKPAKVVEESDSPDYVVYFNEGSSNIIGSDEVQQYLNALSKRVKQSKEKIEIVGFDDNIRTDTESLELAKRRTWRVRKAFADNFVRRKLVQVKNVGQSEPRGTNETEEGRSKNRRVEIRILKK